MERIISQEERIRRAEEIYQRRKNQDIRINTGAGLNDNSKGQIFIFKNLFLKITICAVIYTSFYVIKNSNYFFSKDVLNKVNEILSYDMDFQELYNIASEYISNFYSLDNKMEDQDKQNSNGETESQNAQSVNSEAESQDAQNANGEAESQNAQNANGEAGDKEPQNGDNQDSENHNNKINSQENVTSNINENQNISETRCWGKR